MTIKDFNGKPHSLMNVGSVDLEVKSFDFHVIFYVDGNVFVDTLNNDTILISNDRYCRIYYKDSYSQILTLKKGVNVNDIIEDYVINHFIWDQFRFPIQ